MRQSHDRFDDRVSGKIKSLIANALNSNDRFVTDVKVNSSFLGNIGASLYKMGVYRLTNLQFDLLRKISATTKNMILSCAPGTGKTIAYGIKIIKQVDTSKLYPQVLCMCSTYEAAIQTQTILSQMAVGLGVVIGNATQDGKRKWIIIHKLLMLPKYSIFNKYYPCLQLKNWPVIFWWEHQRKWFPSK